MAQRFASSMRPTIYATAASCRHIIVHPWKGISYLPTCMAISWTSHEKGSFRIKSSVLFWNHCISWRATVPGRYLLGFFYLACLQEFLLGGFASHGRSELLACGFLPTRFKWSGLRSHLDQLSGGR